jgi:hypothetical protein
MIILKLLVFAIPATLAAVLHMVVVKFNLLGKLKYPLDFNLTYNGKRIFGDSKTFRGLFAMVILSILSSYFLYWLTITFDTIAELNIIDFVATSPLIIGVAFGLGYVLAELPNSFVKRQLEIVEGKRGNVLNIIIDQIDSPIGCMLAIIPFSRMSISFFLTGVVFFLFLHMFINVMLYLAGLRKNPL